jgi:hypothetical protein
MSWKIPRIWEGEDVWVLGGGPSVAIQFGVPKKVVQSVIEGTLSITIFSSYMVPIHDKHVIGVNVAYKIGDWVDAMFFGDISFLYAQSENLCNFSGLKLSCHHAAAKYPWVKFIEKDRDHPRGISSRPDRISWNANSGAAAISVAAWAGAKRILLLGFDMQLSADKMQHFHDEYKRGKIVDEGKRRKWDGAFNRHLIGFGQIAQDAKKMGIEILNVNPDSAINEFKKVNLRDVL